MSDLIPYGEQLKKLLYISVKSENAEYGDAFVQKLADFFAKNYPELKKFNRHGLYRMKQFYELYKDNEKVSPLVTQCLSLRTISDEK